MGAVVWTLVGVLAAAVVVTLLVALRRPLGKLLKLAGKTGLGLGVLALLKGVGGAIGLSLGVNLWNALALALLGVPGLGLLMLLNWLTVL